MATKKAAAKKAAPRKRAPKKAAVVEPEPVVEPSPPPVDPRVEALRARLEAAQPGSQEALDAQADLERVG